MCDTGYQKYLVILPGVKEFLVDLKRQKIQVGVISNSPQVDEVNTDHFKSVGLSEYIDKYTFSYGAKCKNLVLKYFNWQ